MVDYREHFDDRPSQYQQTQGSGYIGPIIALAVIAVLVGGIFFLSSGSAPVDLEGNPAAPIASDTGTAIDPAAPMPAQ